MEHLARKPVPGRKRMRSTFGAVISRVSFRSRVSTRDTANARMSAAGKCARGARLRTP